MGPQLRELVLIAERKSVNSIWGSPGMLPGGAPLGLEQVHSLDSGPILRTGRDSDRHPPPPPAAPGGLYRSRFQKKQKSFERKNRDNLSTSHPSRQEARPVKRRLFLFWRHGCSVARNSSACKGKSLRCLRKSRFAYIDTSPALPARRPLTAALRPFRLHLGCQTHQTCSLPGISRSRRLQGYLGAVA